MKDKSLSFDIGDALSSSYLSALGTYGGVQALNALDLAFLIPSKIDSLKKEKEILENKLKANPNSKRLSNELKNVSDKIKLYTQFNKDMKPSLFPKGSQQYTSKSKYKDVYDDLLGNKVTEKILDFKLKDIFPKSIQQKFPESVNKFLKKDIYDLTPVPKGIKKALGFRCPVGRRSLLALSMGLAGLLGGFGLKDSNKKLAFTKKASSEKDNKNKLLSSLENGLIGMGSMAAGNELITDFLNDKIKATTNPFLPSNSVFLMDGKNYPFIYDKNGKVHIDNSKWKKFVDVYKNSIDNFSDFKKDLNAYSRYIDNKSKVNPFNTQEKIKNLIQQLGVENPFNNPKEYRHMNKLRFLNKVLSGSEKTGLFGVIGNLADMGMSKLNLKSDAPKAKKNIGEKIVDLLRLPNNPPVTKSFSNRFFNPYYMSKRTKGVYGVGLLAALLNLLNN